MIKFLKKLFGSQDKNTEPATKSNGTKTLLETNAPSHWPQLESDSSFQAMENNIHKMMLSSLMYNSKIVKSVSEFYKVEPKTSYSTNVDLIEEPICGSSSIKQLTEDGIVFLNAAIKENDKKYAVLVFENGVNKATLNRANELLKPYGYEDLIWYSKSQPIDGVQIELPMYTFDKTCFHPIENYRSKFANYAMWWSSPGQSNFTISSECSSITKFYQAIENYEMAINGLFGVILKLHPQIDYVELPDELLVPIHGPSSEVLLLRVSKERGFNFYFPVNERMSVYRKDFLREMTSFICESMDMLKESGYKPQTTVSEPLNWWNKRMELQRKDEENKEHSLLSIFESMSQSIPINN